jgi:hypothetical protein
MGLFADRDVARLREALAQAVDRVEDDTRGAPLAELAGLSAFRVTLGGRECRVVPQHATGSGGSRGAMVGAVVIAPAADVPFELRVTGRGVLTLGLPRADAGDAALAGDFRVGATQPDVARALLDPETCGRLRAVFASMPRFSRRAAVFLSVGKGRAAWLVPMRKEGGGILFPGEPPSPTDLRDAVGWTLALADRVGHSFERVRAEVDRSGGPQAAAAWVEAQRTALAGMAQAKRRGLLLLVGGVLGCALLGVLIVVVIAVVAVTSVPRGRAHAPAHR